MDPMTRLRVQAAVAMHTSRKASVKTLLTQLDRRILDMRLTVLQYRIQGLQRESDL